eukprot:2801401-Pleurochrysis_carterae.AAC.1
MDLPAEMCLSQLGLQAAEGGMVVRYKQKYNINQAGCIEWKLSPSIDTYYIQDMNVLSEYLSFHERAVASGLAAYGSSKGVVVRREGLK